MKGEYKMKQTETETELMWSVRKVATICMYTIGGFFIFLGIVGTFGIGYITGIMFIIGGLITIPCTRDYISKKSETKRIGGIMALVILFVSLIIASIAAPPMEVSTDTTPVPNDVATSITTPTPKPTPNPTPTPDIITLSAIKMLPMGTELGDKEGWSSVAEKDNTRNIATRKYYKDNRGVTITVNVLSSNEEAKRRYYEIHDRLGYDEYPTLSVGELSMMYTMKSTNTLSEYSQGYFVKKNMFVEIQVHDYWIYDSEVKTYARQVDRKID